jgi:hypothetical protein
VTGLVHSYGDILIGRWAVDALRAQIRTSKGWDLDPNVGLTDSPGNVWCGADQMPKYPRSPV